MNQNLLLKAPLFYGIEGQNIKNLIDCLKGTIKTYSKNEAVYRCGDTTKSMGLVLSGSVSIEYDDMWGNKSVIDIIGPGQVFAENYAYLPDEPIMINVISTNKTKILFLNVNSIFSACSTPCPFHSKLIKNMLTISAKKSLNLSRRILHTSSKSIRGRLLSYLSYQSKCNNCREFIIPFNRQQLADYLNVDRSALSNELSKMQKDGLIKVNLNKFTLYYTE